MRYHEKLTSRASRWVAAATLLSLVAAGGCAPQTRSRSLRLAVEASPGTLDPHHHNEVAVWALLCNFYDGLVRFSGDMTLEPALATEWHHLDATHVRFALRHDVVFHDDEPFTSADVVASFERARRDPSSGIRHQLLGIVSVTADGPDAVIVETERPAPTLLNRLAYLFIVPARDASLPEITHPVGTGPYRFIGRDADGTVHLAAFARNWRGTPPIPTVVYGYRSNDPARMAEFYAGEWDLVHRVPDSELSEVSLHPGLRVEPAPRMAVQLLRIIPPAASGRTREALSDRRVRRAMLMALDRRRLVDEVFNGNGTVASQYVHPVVFGYDPGIAPVPYDPAAARDLLKEAGFPDGFDVDLSCGPNVRYIIDPLVRDLAAVGIRVTVREYPFPELVRLGPQGTIAFMFYARTCTTGDASDFFNSLIHTPDPARGYGAENWGGYSNPEVDALLEQADQELDPKARLRLLHDAQRRTLDDLPILPLTIRWGYIGLRDGLEVVPRHDEWLWIAGMHWKD